MSTAEPQGGESRVAFVLLGIFGVAFVWSAIRPHDYFTWFLEVLPAMLGLVALAATYRRFRLTTLLYVLICGHAIVLLVGGHYTYAEVPLGNWVRDAFHLARNPYDRLGHFVQGFVPAILAREVLIRNRVVKRGGWLSLLVFCFCMAVSALYELFEYAVAMSTGSAADAFLGSQGDPWDTQNDMLMCMIGAITALLTLSCWHDRVLARIPERTAPDAVRGTTTSAD
jgi:putative membrane protein